MRIIFPEFEIFNLIQFNFILFVNFSFVHHLFICLAILGFRRRFFCPRPTATLDSKVGVPP